MTPGARILALALVTVVTLAGCAATGSESEQVAPDARPAYPVLQTYPDIEVIADLSYGAGPMLVDVCLPNADAPEAVGTGGTAGSRPRAAVLVVHGGSWMQGDKASIAWRSVCQWLASEGFVGLSVNYRLAPENPYPAGIQDVRQVVTWLRELRQVERFDIDPDRIGALGGSAGGNLVAQLGLEGAGKRTGGSRVAAVVDISGPIDLTTDGFSLGGVVPSFRDVQLSYLGCASYSQCPQARDASPLYDVDETDPAFFVAHSTAEMIPIQQSDALVAALREAGVDTTYVTLDGALHSIAMLDDELRARIAEWLRSKLAP